MLQIANVRTSETPTAYYTLKVCPRHPAYLYTITMSWYPNTRGKSGFAILYYYYNMFLLLGPLSLKSIREFRLGAGAPPNEKRRRKSPPHRRLHIMETTSEISDFIHFIILKHNFLSKCRRAGFVYSVNEKKSLS